MFNYKLDFYCCEYCLHGKHNQEKFPSIASREERILDLILSDVFGPIPIPSLGGSLYYVSFIDDLSRNTWLYILKNKYKVLGKFKDFKALLENQTRKKIKVIRSGNGDEFYGNKSK